MYKSIQLLMSIILTISPIILSAQESEGGIPYTFQSNISFSNIDTKAISKPLPSVIAKAYNNEKEAFQIGQMSPVNINTNNSGTWKVLADGSKIWQLKIHGEDALALALHYSCLYIPDGAELFLYNEYKNHVIGKFNSSRNFNNPITHTQMIQGETTYLEYYAPSGIISNPIIQINQVAYIFRGVEDFVNPIIQDAQDKTTPLYEKADNCQVDVACSPENNGWSEQIDAVVHYTYPASGGGYYVCSASLLNNTSQDCTPYILSAWHCGENSAGTSLNGYTWYWNYQKSSCQPNSNGSDPSKGSDTKINGTVRASSCGSGTICSGSLNQPPSNQQVAGSDFYLVDLGSSIPTSYNAYYAGWNNGTSGSPSGVSIHHPSGSAKKISTYNSSLSSATYNGGANSAHWMVTWSATTNGHGVTEGGSSGAPIFDQNGRVIGQLTGGSSYCTATGSPDLYGKFSKNWNANGANSDSQLEPWLDPGSTGVSILDGAYEPCSQSNPPTCAINTSTTTITAGGSVTFSDASSGIPTSWSWNFDNTSLGGVTPPTSNSQNPGAVTYSNSGTYEVQLSATNANGTCSTTVNITVNTPGSSTGCDTLLNITATDTLRVYSTTNGGYLSGWNGYGDLSKSEAYSNYAPYNSITGIEILFYGVNDGGNGATVDFNVWDDNGGQPGSIIATTQVSLSTLDASLAATGGQGLYLATFPSSVSLNGNTFYCGITMNGFATYPGGLDSLGIITNSINDPTPNTGWEQWDTGVWYDMNTAWGGIDISQYIRPIVCGGCASSIIITPTTTNATCNTNNGAINITASGGTTPYQYSIDGGITFQSNGSFTNLAVGTYNIVIEDAGICSETSTITINNVGGVTPTITSDQSICAGNSASITASGAGAGGSYLWDNGLGSGSSHVVSPSTTTTYSVTITDINGCTATASVIISVDTPPTVSVNPASGTVCSGESITITASGAQSYSWNTGATSSSITVNPTSQTTYTVIGQNGSCAGSPVSSTISVTQSPTVTASANPTTIAIGGTVTFSNAGSGATSYSWDFGDGNTSTQNNPSHTYTTSGIFTVTLTGTLNGCTSTSQVIINVGGVNIPSYDLENAISIIPNPNNGKFELLISIPEKQDLEIVLFNSIGQKIMSDHLSNVMESKLSYDLNNQPGGIYYLSVLSSTEKITKKLLVFE